MKKIMLGIMIIAIIAITSGAYAVLSENSDVPVDNALYAADNNVPVNSDLTLQNNDNNVRFLQSGAIGENKDETVYVGKYAFYKRSEGLADRYVQCVDCGGFVAVGEVTKQLPDAVICHHFMAELSPEYKDFTYSSDEVYQIWVDAGQPVYDDGNSVHEEQADSSVNTPYYGDVLAQYEEVVE